MITIALGFILGALGVGLPTLRILKVMEGKYVQAFFIALMATLNFYVFTNMIVEKNYKFMIANSIGAALSVSYLAFKRRAIN